MFRLQIERQPHRQDQVQLEDLLLPQFELTLVSLAMITHAKSSTMKFAKHIWEYRLVTASQVMAGKTTACSAKVRTTLHMINILKLNFRNCSAFDVHEN